MGGAVLVRAFEHVYRPHGYGLWHIADDGAARTLCGQLVGSGWHRHPFDSRSGGLVECRRCRASYALDHTIRRPISYG